MHDTRVEPEHYKMGYVSPEFRDISELPVLGIRNAEVGFEELNGLDLALIQIQSLNTNIGEPR